MNDFLNFVKTYRSDIIGVIQIFIALWIEHRNRRKK